MSTAAASLPPCSKLGAEWYKAPIDFNDWIRAGRRVWTYYRRRVRHRRRDFTASDREIGRSMPNADGTPASRRTVQRGHKFLELIGAIFRDHSGGHGRVVRILLPLAGEKDKEAGGAPKPARAEAPAAATPSPPPTPPPVEEPPAEPDGPADWSRVRSDIARTRAEIAAAPGPDPTREPPPVVIRGVDNTDIAYLEFKEKMGELTEGERRRLEDARRTRSP